jgi:hypothetical protein
MFPALLPRDRITLVREAAYATGDVVGFIGPDGEAVAHRVLGQCAATGAYLTAGDNNGGHDAPVPAGAVLGRVASVERQVLGVSFTVPPALWQRRLLPVSLSRPLTRVAVQAVAILAAVGLWSPRSSIVIDK